MTYSIESRFCGSFLSDLVDVMPLLEGIVRRTLFIDSGTVDTPNYSSPTRGPLKSKHAGQRILLLRLSDFYKTRVSKELWTYLRPSEKEVPQDLSVSYILSLVGHLSGSVDAQFIRFHVQAICFDSTELVIDIQPIQLKTLGLVTPNTATPFLTRYDINGANTVITAVYDPDPSLAVQRDFKITMDIPSSPILAPSLDDNPISYSIALEFLHIVDIDKFLDSYVRLREYSRTRIGSSPR